MYHEYVSYYVKGHDLAGFPALELDKQTYWKIYHDIGRLVNSLPVHISRKRYIITAIQIVGAYWFLEQNMVRVPINALKQDWVIKQYEIIRAEVLQAGEDFVFERPAVKDEYIHNADNQQCELNLVNLYLRLRKIQGYSHDEAWNLATGRVTSILRNTLWLDIRQQLEPQDVARLMTITIPKILSYHKISLSAFKDELSNDDFIHVYDVLYRILESYD